MAEAVYILCAATSLTCAFLLYRGYKRSRARFLLWSSLCFAALAGNNVLLFVDRILVPDYDLSFARTFTALVGVTLLVFGLVWDTE